TIKKCLEELSVPYQDMGANQLDPDDDYPDFAKLVAEKIVAEQDGRGILVCGTGLGMCLVANKFKGIRATAPFDEFGAQQSREHLDANVLCLGEKTIAEDEAKKIVQIWLNTDFSSDARHQRRLGKVE
ncbi:MAG: ribose 5-phosphate isomerase B, partial [Candidatus Portnoybacteria bacterium CG10_big_fil_rev_8_21_14_0_10_40_22]